MEGSPRARARVAAAEEDEAVDRVARFARGGTPKKDEAFTCVPLKKFAITHEL